MAVRTVEVVEPDDPDDMEKDHPHSKGFESGEVTLLLWWRSHLLDISLYFIFSKEGELVGPGVVCL